MRKKKELTEAEKRDLAMKYEVAEELGLLEKVERCGWRGLTSRESGRIGGIMGTRKTAERKRTEVDKVDRVDTYKDREWTGEWTAERHFLSIRIPACI